MKGRGARGRHRDAPRPEGKRDGTGRAVPGAPLRGGRPGGPAPLTHGSTAKKPRRRPVEYAHLAGPAASPAALVVVDRLRFPEVRVRDSAPLRPSPARRRRRRRRLRLRSAAWWGGVRAGAGRGPGVREKAGWALRRGFPHGLDGA